MKSNRVTQYVKTAGGYVAYQVLGDGPVDILFMPNWASNLEVMWESPSLSRYLNRLASFGRLICFDKRGTGVSDPVPLSTLPTLEEWMDDAREVLDAVGSQRAVLIGDAEGGMMAILFSATYPERTSALVLVNAFARFLRDEDYPIGLPQASFPKLMELYEANYGTGGFLETTAPSMAEDDGFRHWAARYERLAMPPGAATAMYRWLMQVDVRAVLGAIQAPTLVLHREDNQHYRIGFGRYLGEHIPGARFVPVPGTDCYPFYAGDFQKVLDEIEEFLTGEKAAPDPQRVLATILFTDIVGSTQYASRVGDERWQDVIAAHDALIRQYIQQYRGREIDTTGDGFKVLFDGPGRAIACAAAISGEMSRLGLEIRSGLHTGEVVLGESGLAGIAVHIAARIMALAGPGEVLVSRTVKDLVVGSSIVFEDRGSYALKGVPEEWQLYRVSNGA